MKLLAEKLHRSSKERAQILAWLLQILEGSRAVSRLFAGCLLHKNPFLSGSTIYRLHFTLSLWHNNGQPTITDTPSAACNQLSASVDVPIPTGKDFPVRLEHLKPEIVLTGVEPTTVVTNAAFMLIGDGVLRKLPASSPPLG